VAKCYCAPWAKWRQLRRRSRPAERDYVRRELDMFFSTYPTVAEGFQLKTWRGGPQAGQPKLPPPARSLLERGLMRLDTGLRPPQLFFTDAGLVELRAMMADRKDHEGNDIARQACAVQHAAAALVELPAAAPASEPAVATSRDLRPLRHRSGVTVLREGYQVQRDYPCSPDALQKGGVLFLDLRLATKVAGAFVRRARCTRPAVDS
jgi:hypothetical protein